MWGKDDGDYDSPTRRDETLDFMKIEEAKEAPPPQKKEAKEAHKKLIEKDIRDNVTILFPHLCFKVAPWSSW